MKMDDGTILPGGIVSFSGRGVSVRERLIPLKTIKNIYNTKKYQESKKKFLKPLKNETLKEFSIRVDSEKRRNLIESDREAFRNKKSQKNKLKRLKRESRNRDKTKADGEDDLSTKSGLCKETKTKYDLTRIETPLFGDVIDSPPTFSIRLKEKLDKAKRSSENRTKDLHNYAESVRKAYLEIKERRIGERSRYFNKRCGKKDKILNDFGDSWVGIGKFKRDQD
ncbi:hypothetical protein FG386_002892 [Cryptosporidium ryanae]|uniref:uncharacterized protein n=1 Tax=Cryptosporidium ryanae TaxID=515981 RepID=UPI00351AA7D7|nr:hypothetical protein FG386_002892 [Cryptosporidium ryanae]